MTVRQILALAVKKLKSQTNPHLEAEILLSHILKKPREYLFTHPEAKLSKAQVTSYKLQVTRRLKGVPIAYLVGEKEFYGLKFFVNKNVLIPRPETEMMVEETLKRLTIDKLTTDKNTLTIVDVGTGSGCAIITLAKQLQNSKPQFYACGLYATDISNKALANAKKNAAWHNVHKHIRFYRGDLLAPVLRKKSNVKGQMSIVVLANLPYLTPAQIKKSPSIRLEPKLALEAGPDGLKYYRRLFRQIKRARLKNFILLCEIDPGQKSSIRRLAKVLLPPHRLEIKKDLKRHSRLAVISSN